MPQSFRRSLVRIGVIVILVELSAFALLKAGLRETSSLAISCTAGTVALTWSGLLRLARRTATSFSRAVAYAERRLTDRRTWQFSRRTRFLVALLLLALLAAAVRDCLLRPQGGMFWTTLFGEMIAGIVLLWVLPIALRAWARHRYRFSIKALLVAVTVFALLCGATKIAWERPGLTTRIEGRVIYGDNGNPAVGVVVSAQAIDGQEPYGGGRALTDGNGRYRLPELPAGKYNIWADQAGFTVNALDSFLGRPFTTLDRLRGEDTTHAPDLRLIRGGFVAGRVIDVDTGRPMHVFSGRRANVGLYGPSRPKSGACIAIAPIQNDGTFRIRAAPGKNYIYLPWTIRDSPQLRTAAWVDVLDGQTVEVEFRVRSKGD